MEQEVADRNDTPRTRRNSHRQAGFYYNYHYQHHLLLNSYRSGYGFAGLIGYNNNNHYHHHHHRQAMPGLLPLPSSLPIQLGASPPPPLLQNDSFGPKFKKAPRKPTNASLLATSSDSQFQEFLGAEEIQKKVCLPLPHDKQSRRKAMDMEPPSLITVARRPDSGGVEGKAVSILANHFLVRFDPLQRIFHYDVDISPSPSKEVARMIKKKMIEENSSAFSCSSPAYDGRKTLYSPIEFEDNRLEFYVSLPLSSSEPSLDVMNLPGSHRQKLKIFKVNIKLVSKLDGKGLTGYLEKEDGDECTKTLPQEYIHALDVVLREGAVQKCSTVGRSLYSNTMEGSNIIGGGAVALRGFFQSLRPTQQGLSLNVDFSVTAFHESIGVIAYLQKRLDFMRNISEKKGKFLTVEEKGEVERALKHIRVFVSHRETIQRYRVYGLTREIADDIFFPDRDGKSLRLVDYFRDHYGYDVEYRNLPCLQISRRKPCYLPMELCVICEGQKFLGKLTDDQTVEILKMGCQKPRVRRKIIDQVMEGPMGPNSGNLGKEFKLQVSKEMTKLTGRILEPPKLRLGNDGHVRNLTPSRHDRQWNLLDSHVFEGARVDRWTIMSFGGLATDRSPGIQRFIHQLTQRCEQLGILLNKSTVVSPIYEPMHVLGSPRVLESKLRKVHRAALGNLQLLVCVMERKHKGYADLKRIAETNIGIVSQCCLYSNISKPSSQFLANLALKINAKVGGCTVALYSSLPCQIPRLFALEDPAIFMGADVTHPHPLDDYSPSVAAVVGSVNWPSCNKYVSRMRSQAHRQEIIQDLSAMVGEILDDFLQELSQLPGRIVFFRDGVSETQFQKVLQHELKAIREGCKRFHGYDPPITFAVVQKRHHTRLFPPEGDLLPSEKQFSDENIPPGTVVDTVITHPREFDFYLCSHWGVKGTSRPIHYHILWDENCFTSDEVQKLVYNLCYTFVRCTKPISLVPPAYYAHLAAYRGRLYLEQSDSMSSKGSAMCRSSPPKTTPLPKLSENVRKLMFYC